MVLITEVFKGVTYPIDTLTMLSNNEVITMTTAAQVSGSKEEGNTLLITLVRLPT